MFSVQFSSVAQLCPTLCHPMYCSMPGLPEFIPEFTNSQSLPKVMSIESLIPSNNLILCRSFCLLPSIVPSIRIFSNESVLPIGWPKYWKFSFNISPSNEYLDWSPLGWIGCISLQSKGPQESSPTPQSKIINSSVFSFLYSPNLTSIRDHWKNHSLD